MTFPREIGQPATRALVAAGYSSIDDLAAVPDRELLALHGVGPKAVKVIRERLASTS